MASLVVLYLKRCWIPLHISRTRPFCQFTTCTHIKCHFYLILVSVLIAWYAHISRALLCGDKCLHTAVARGSCFVSRGKQPYLVWRVSTFLQVADNCTRPHAQQKVSTQAVFDVCITSNQRPKRPIWCFCWQTDVSLQTWSGHQSRCLRTFILLRTCRAAVSFKLVYRVNWRITLRREGQYLLPIRMFSHPIRSN